MSQLMRYIWWSLFNLHVVCKDPVFAKEPFLMSLLCSVHPDWIFPWEPPDQHQEPRINCRKTNRKRAAPTWGQKNVGFNKCCFFWEPTKNVNKDFFVATKVKCNRMLFGFQQKFQLSTTSWWRNLLKNMYRWSAITSLLKKVDRYMGLHKHCTLDTSTVAKQNRWEMRNRNYPYIHT